jgi:hypothetical protein
MHFKIPLRRRPDPKMEFRQLIPLFEGFDFGRVQLLKKKSKKGGGGAIFLCCLTILQRRFRVGPFIS